MGNNHESKFDVFDTEKGLNVFYNMILADLFGVQFGQHNITKNLFSLDSITNPKWNLI